MAWRLRGCPRCGGDQQHERAIAMVGQQEGWRCLQCGLEIEETREEAGLTRRETRDNAGICDECPTPRRVPIRHRMWHPVKDRLVWACPTCEGLLHERRGKIEWERVQRAKVEALA